MTITLLDRIKSFFARDKNAFWWNHFSDEEKQLRRMSVWQLARVIHNEGPQGSSPEQRIVAEHMLSVRLTNLQTRATHIATISAFIGAIGAVFLQSLQPPRECECKAHAHGEKQQGVAEPKQKLVPPIIPLPVPNSNQEQGAKQPKANP